MPGLGREHRNVSAGGWLSSRMRAGLGSSLPPLLLANGLARPVTLVVSLMNQYLDMSLSHTAQIDAVFLRAGYGVLAKRPFSVLLSFGAPAINTTKDRAWGVGLHLRT